MGSPAPDWFAEVDKKTPSAAAPPPTTGDWFDQVDKSAPHATASVPPPAAPSSWWDSVKNFGKGAVKGVGEFAANLGDQFINPTYSLANGVLGIGTPGAAKAALAPQSDAEGVGNFLGKIGAATAMPGAGMAGLAEDAGTAAEGVASQFLPKLLSSAAGKAVTLGTHGAEGGAMATLQGQDPAAGFAGGAAGSLAGKIASPLIDQGVRVVSRGGGSGGALAAAKVAAKVLPVGPAVRMAARFLPDAVESAPKYALDIPQAPSAVSSAVGRLAQLAKKGVAGAAGSVGADLATGQDVTGQSVGTGAAMGMMTPGTSRGTTVEPEIQRPNPRSRATVVDNPNVPDTAQGWGDSRPLQADPRSSVRSPLDELRMAVSSQGPQLRSPSNVIDNPGVADTADPWVAPTPTLQTPNPRSRATVVDNPAVSDTDQSWVAALQHPNPRSRATVVDNPGVVDDEGSWGATRQTPNPRSGATVMDQSAVQDTGDPWGSALPQAAAPHTSAPIEALRAAVSPAKAPAKTPSALDSFHVVNPDTATTQVNGSGSNVGGGSDEENRRLAAMATNGQQRIVRKRTGEIVNLNDPSHVDYRVQPGEIHGIAQANGDVEVHDTGAGVTPDALAALKAQVKKMRTTNAGVASTATAKPEPIHPEIRNLYEGLQPQLDLSRENHENGTTPLPASHPALNPMTLEQFADQTMHGDPKKLWSKQRAVRKLIEAERAAKTSKGGA